jgi:hypothetical protein
MHDEMLGAQLMVETQHEFHVNEDASVLPRETCLGGESGK